MNELQLSKDLNVITAEIQSYKQIAGQSIFEIGRRLKHVKENDLAYGQWSSWLESIGMNRSTAHRFIKTYEELPADVDTWQQLSSRALYEIATLPEEEREKEHKLDSGEAKTVDEMTVRELQEVKRKLKQAESQAELERKERERLEKELDNIEPEKIEVIPDDYHFYKGNYESTKRLSERYKLDNEQLRNELNQVHDQLKNGNKGKLDTSKLEQLKEQEQKIIMRLDTYDKMHHIQTLLENTMSEVVKNKSKLNIGGDIEVWKIEEFERCLDEVESMCHELREILPNKNIIEGEIVNE